MPQQPSSPEPARTPSEPLPSPAAGRSDRSDTHHPADAAHDLSDSDAHARSPEQYTEEPGSHRREGDGKALDVGG